MSLNKIKARKSKGQKQNTEAGMGVSLVSFSVLTLNKIADFYLDLTILYPSLPKKSPIFFPFSFACDLLTLNPKSCLFSTTCYLRRSISVTFVSQTSIILELYKTSIILVYQYTSIMRVLCFLNIDCYFNILTWNLSSHTCELLLILGFRVSYFVLVLRV